MFPISTRQVVKVSVVAAVSAVLYRYWLLAPVLGVLSMIQWCAAALAVAAVFGGVLGMWRFNVLVLIFGTMVGLFLGGTWAGWHTPGNDMPASIGAAFESNLESFWRVMILILLIITVTVSGVFSARFARDRSRH